MSEVINNGCQVSEEMRRLLDNGSEPTRNGLAFINNTNGRGNSHVVKHSGGTQGGISRAMNKQMPSTQRRHGNR